MSLAINKIYLGDARDLLLQVEPNSIACSVWSPPYFVGKQYEEYLSYQDWIELLKTVICHHQVLLKPGGFLAINVADILCFQDKSMPKIQAQNIRRHRSAVTREAVLEAKAAHPNYSRYELAKLLGCSEQTIDRRLNGNNIRGGKSNTQTRVHLIGGIVEAAGMEAGLYLYDRRIWVKDAAWENSKWHTLSYRSVDEFEYIYFFWKPGETLVDRHRLTPEEWVEWGSRGVWKISSVRANDDHEAKFPVELPRRVIKLLTDPNDTILDCFVGSGSSAVAAIREERNYIGIDIKPEYVRLANKLCAEENNKMSASREKRVCKLSQQDVPNAIQLNGNLQLSLLEEA